MIVFFLFKLGVRGNPLPEIEDIGEDILCDDWLDFNTEKNGFRKDPNAEFLCSEWADDRARRSKKGK